LDSQQTIDHSAWDRILDKYVSAHADNLNRFAYNSVTAEDRNLLRSYLQSLSQIEISNYSRPVQFAYWVNMYNALTVSVILDHYPVKSIRDIDISGLLSNGPWSKELIAVEDADLALDDIEHAILRPIWKDPRIHYAVNCASVGCPNLHNQAFTAENTNALLEQMAYDYINSPRGVSIKNGKVTVSKIYSWFAYDFGNSEKAILKHLIQYASSATAAELMRIGKLSSTAYDWSLNE